MGETVFREGHNPQCVFSDGDFCRGLPFMQVC